MVALQLAFTYVPAFNRVFRTAPIDLVAWLWITGLAISSALIVEAEKRWRPQDRFVRSNRHHLDSGRDEKHDQPAGRRPE